MAFLSELLPKASGLLPKWQLLVSSIAIFNSIQNYYATGLTKRLYSNKPEQVSPLQARSFAVWTATSAIVRFYCAYHITEKTIYEITIWTYILALLHFVSEVIIFRTANIGIGVLSPLVVATTSLTWMLKQYEFYVAK